MIKSTTMFVNFFDFFFSRLSAVPLTLNLGSVPIAKNNNGVRLHGLESEGAPEGGHPRLLA